MQFHAALHAWYAANGRRDLPWRNTRNPYEIWLSEVMLQQTQVKTVLERFYFPFLKAFPTLEALASAPQEDVLKAWQGLGYYSRAVNLHKAAKQCGPSMPHSVEALQSLPGIGRNTAHAIACFAFGEKVPVLEANVKRVLARIFALSHAGEKELWKCAEQLLDAENPFDYNQAMMDVGAMLCTPRTPKCGQCPANVICTGKENPEAFPAKKTAKKTPTRKRIIVVKMDAGGRIHATPRTTRFLHGLYEFDEITPSLRVQRSNPEFLPSEGWIASALPRNDSLTHLGHITQIYSHFTLSAEVYLQRTGKKERGNNWYTLKEFAQLPHSKAEEKILTLILEYCP